MQSTNVNGVSIYNLSTGKAMPRWLSDRQRRQLSRQDEYRNRIDLLQDFEFPTAATCLDMSADGEFIVAGGGYPPALKVFELDQMSMKCERRMDAGVVRAKILSDDFRKVALLLDDRTVEFHAAFGKHHQVRIPKFGRDLAYQRSDCDLYVCGSSSEIYRINLDQGRFLAPFKTASPGANKLAVNPMHQLVAVAGEDGFLECWDPRRGGVRGGGGDSGGGGGSGGDGGVR